jgi:catechol 2,3-dioxygenase-like lactoylglutathione lyase family enzyme
MPASRPQLTQLNIVSSDMEASLAFYRRLGVEIPDDENGVWRTTSGAHHASAVDAGTHMDIDSTRFAAIWNSGWQGRGDLGGRVVVGFSVASREEVDRRYADLTTAGYRGLQPPYDAFWGARYAVVEDPDGIAVGLMSPIVAAHRSPPPEV